MPDDQTKKAPLAEPTQLEKMMAIGHEALRAALGIAEETRKKGDYRYKYYVDQGKEIESWSRDEYEKVVSRVRNGLGDAFSGGRSWLEEVDAQIWRSFGGLLHHYGVASRDQVLDTTEKIVLLTDDIKKLTKRGRRVKSHARSPKETTAPTEDA